jgi:hypothetical protein
MTTILCWHMRKLSLYRFIINSEMMVIEPGEKPTLMLTWKTTTLVFQENYRLSFPTR